MTEPVSRPYKLPPAVIARLTDIATPERVIASREAWRDESHPCADIDEEEAQTLYEDALCAAALRECEAKRALRRHGFDANAAIRLRHARNAYDALRNWRKTT